MFLFLLCPVQTGSDAPAKLVSNTYREIFPLIFTNMCVKLIIHLSSAEVKNECNFISVPGMLE